MSKLLCEKVVVDGVKRECLFSVVHCPRFENLSKCCHIDWLYLEKVAIDVVVLALRCEELAEC